MGFSYKKCSLTAFTRFSFVMLGLMLVFLAAPERVHAQAIGGTVTDSTGGVLPGVTVEARSPALIEGVRTGISDGNGNYQLIALEPGEYSVTFTLPGFNTLVREGVQISGSITANIDGQLSVGSVEETVTVSGEAPAVDVQNIIQSETITSAVFEVLPTARGYDSMGLLIPAMNIQGGPTTTLSVDTGGISGEGNNRLSIHGSRDSDAEVQIDGMDSNLVAFEGAPQGTPFDAAIQEYVYDYSGNSAEVQTGGVRLNLIPKEGGNEFSGGLYSNMAHSGWLANNIGQELIDRGITGGKDGGVKMDQSWAVSPSLGGPIVKDKLWFFTTYSFRRGSLFPANLYDNTDVAGFAYVPDVTAPTRDRSDIYEGTIRLTWQMSSKDKVQAYWSNNHTRQIPSLTGSSLDPIYISPEAGSELVTAVNTYQLTWLRPQSNSVLFEAGFALQPAHNILNPLTEERGQPLGARTDLPSVFEGSTLTMHRNMGFFFNGTDVHYSTANTSGRASVSYVTGSHNFKFGTTLNYKKQNESYRSDNNWTNMITYFGNPVQAQFNARSNETNELLDIGIYAQDRWTIDRLTINAGIRFDYFKGMYPDQATEPMTWSPISREFPGMTVAAWKDLQPRLGIVYDLSGDGRTALKASASRYGDRNAISLAGEVNPVANNISVSRLWLDGAYGCLPHGPLPAHQGTTCVPGDGLVQGDAMVGYPNGEIMDFTPNPGFASPAITAFFDPDYAFGWNKKSANWEFSGSIQHELRDGLNLDIGYFRRAYVNYNAVDDRSNNPEDWDEFTIMVPTDSRLPDGGGFPLTLVDLNPAAVAVADSWTTNANNYGGMSETWQGVDLNFSARVEGFMIQGGFATGKSTTDECALNQSLPERINEGAGGLTGGGDTHIPIEYCSHDTPWISQGSVFGSYTLPGGIDVSGAFFTRNGTDRLAVINVSAAEAAAALGRAPTISTISVNVQKPGTAYGDRMNQFDFRVAKLFDFGSDADLRASLDIFNLFNANAVGRERYTLASFLQPLGVQPGRLMKLSFQFNF